MEMERSIFGSAFVLNIRSFALLAMCPFASLSHGRRSFAVSVVPCKVCFFNSFLFLSPASRILLILNLH